MADEKVIRGRRTLAKIKALAEARKPHEGGVRVEPANERFRTALKHPSGMAFRSTGSVEWPNDRFTKRRLREGSIKLADDGKKEKRPAASSSSHRSAE